MALCRRGHTTQLKVIYVPQEDQPFNSKHTISIPKTESPRYSPRGFIWKIQEGAWRMVFHQGTSESDY